MSTGRVIDLHAGAVRKSGGPGRGVPTRNLTDAERAAHLGCEWFRSCDVLAVTVVLDGNAEVPACAAHLNTVADTWRLRALGARRAQLMSDLDKLTRETARECQRIERDHGEAFPVTDMARVVGASRTSVTKWLGEVVK